MISLKNVTLMRGRQTLLKDANLAIHKGQRMGIIGRNGCGKTSLFKALSGDISFEQGEFFLPSGLRLSAMSQETPGVDRAAIDFVLDAHKEYRKLEKQLLEAEESGNGSDLARIYGELEAIGGYEVRNLAEKLLSGLGFNKNEFNRSIKKFSGGWRVRLNLAAALICPSDLLMLDEPTNHLDLEASVWLEQWLRRYSGTLLLISHDRNFLDSTINHVISFENERLNIYTGNYSGYEKLRAEKMALEESLFEKQKRRREEIEQFVRRFRVKASKAKQAQSRLKELAKMKEIAPAHIDSPFKFNFPSSSSLPDHLLHIKKLSIGFEESLVDEINLVVTSGSRIGLLGFNGSGKSTFLKVLAGQLEKLSGEIIRSKKLRVGYYAQHQVDALQTELTPLNLIVKMSKISGLERKVTEQKMKNFLGGFDFHGERVNETVSNFSGGEKARLALALIVWSRPNLLLMDEPTNHLDIDMCHALEVALQAYEGGLIIVSHDRHLLASTIDEFYSIHAGIFAKYPDSIHDYESGVKKFNGGNTVNVDLPRRSEILKPDRKAIRKSSAAKRQMLAPLKAEVRLLERAIQEKENQLEKIKEELLGESLYQAKNKAHLSELLKAEGKLNIELKKAETKWLEIQVKLDDV
ncbi:MAG: ATP-binding cassette domain-containing protein [Gammaproteobacteria bacterium]|nr:ATP-binding cassette domain-containing protein [Gammaproteobacteria bacterium]